ncbi:MAG: NUDIX hydrolase [Polyangiaceae bacterium]|nr:NUDIX hydrolase [Polyangiaceae bacterium]
MPKAVVGIGKEVLRHLLKRPVVGVAVAGRTADGKWVLIRRGDTGTWALPGGTVEWGETLRTSIARELLEEAGIEHASIGKVIGVYSHPDRDVRFHAVTVLVEATVSSPERPPLNPLEIREVRLFSDADLPTDLAMNMTDMLRDARASKVGEIE